MSKRRFERNNVEQAQAHVMGIEASRLEHLDCNACHGQSMNCVWHRVNNLLVLLLSVHHM